MIIVFGSINLDLVTKTPRLPVAGETLRGYEFFTAAGGKGANQAVAAARLGIPTKLVGRLGNDNFGHQLRRSLQATGVDTEEILVDTETSSGIAVIIVDDAGENQIIFVAGANEHLGDAEATLLLMQLEIPLSVVLSVALAAKQAGVPVILDPAPVQELPPELYQNVDILTPNQVEAAQLVGFPVDNQEAAAQAAKILRQRGVGTVIVKLGDQGAFYASESESFFVPAFPIQAVDSVAAGDAFNGALAAALTKGLPLRQAVVWGAAAGAIATTQAGAQTSLPTLETFNRFLEEHGLEVKNSISLQNF